MALVRIKRFIGSVMVIALLLCLMSGAVFADQASDEHHYLAFASDLRGMTDVLENAFKGMPEDLEYVSLLGDMVGEKDGDAPEYNSSDVFSRVAEMYPDILNRNFSILWADHDENVNDDAMVVANGDGYGPDYAFAGYNEDGSVAYYIYAVGFYDMTAGGIDSYETADYFKHWVRVIDVNIPIIVISHVPVDAKRGDNFGASYWNEALNFAATGVEGITDDETTATVIRNVIFFCGHNYTADDAEYYYESGSKMLVQVDTSINDAQREELGVAYDPDDAVVTEVNDDELGKCTATGVMSNVYYNALYPGYLKTSGNATLMDISERTITFTKYNGGSEVSLGVDGDGNALGTSVSFRRFSESDEGGPVITKQPEDAVVSYPDGAVFTVEVEDPDSIASYQWYMVDIENTKFFLDGSSARTNTLQVPCSLWMNTALDFYCVITGKDGLKTASNHASLSKDNDDVIKPVLYVGEFPVEPGESLDLSTVDIGDGYKLGSGVITYDSNGIDITMDNVHFDNTHTLCGLDVTANVGLTLEYYNPEEPEFTVTLIGENEIVNNFYDYTYNAGGIPFDFYFNGREQDRPVVNIVGDGTLSITNGSIALRVIGDLMIDADIAIKQSRQQYGDGITADNILVSEGTNLDLEVNGSAFTASGNLFMSGSDIKIKASTPHISVGTVTKKVLNVTKSILIENTKLDIDYVSDEEFCGTTGGGAAISCGLDLFITKGSDVNCELSFIGDTIFAGSFSGIYCANAEVEDSSVSVSMDGRQCFGAIGVYAEENMQFTNSDLDVDMAANGAVTGVSAEIDFNADESNVDIIVKGYDDMEDDDCYGVICENFVVKLTDPLKSVKSEAVDGIAVGCDLGLEIQEEPVEFDSEYEAKNVYLREGTVCTVPENSTISLGGSDISGGYGEYVVLETFYDANDTSKPVSLVVFGAGSSDQLNNGNNAADPLPRILAAFAIPACLVAGGAVLNKKKKDESVSE
ncbi:MAG: hypothetical protein IJH64_10630 [Oscillospiraceae bacterium]|nr:hypothetical protein [Oscillospiraceae bacterium]MBR0450606.1 hypothetical protein [Oscillospiraceae bacterium]